MELDYIDKNDEHTDIATGNQLIDESLIGDLPDSAESNAEVAEAETRRSEAPAKSVLHIYLEKVQKRLVAEEAAHGKPLCYDRGDFFD
jgi:hypothetical protein